MSSHIGFRHSGGEEQNLTLLKVGFGEGWEWELIIKIGFYKEMDSVKVGCC